MTRKKHYLAITINVLYIKKMKIYSVSVSNQNLNQEDQIILLMIPKGEVLHHLVVKLSS